MRVGGLGVIRQGRRAGGRGWRPPAAGGPVGPSVAQRYGTVPYRW